MRIKLIFALFWIASAASAQMLRARRLADYAALDDTLAALKAEDSTAGALVENYHPVFDMDTDSCLPSAAISRTGMQNPGVSKGGGLTKDCRSSNFMTTSNTYHRWDRTTMNGVVYEVHMYELYFEKDEASSFISLFGGHTHDVETIIMLFHNNQPEWVGVSAHGNYKGDRTRPWSSVPKQGTHPKVVYHKDGALTHAFRFAKGDEQDAENPTDAWGMPPLASWFKMTGDGHSNANMRDYLNCYSYGSASIKIKDSSCQDDTNKFRQVVFEKGSYTPFFDFGLTIGGWFSEEGTGVGYLCLRLMSSIRPRMVSYIFRIVLKMSA